MTRHFLRDDDLSPAEQSEVLELAARLKRDPYSLKPLAGPQSVAIIFDKTSTRTRFSFAVGVADLGGHPIIVNPGESQLGPKESALDTIRVLERMTSAVVWRTFAQAGLEEMAAHSRVPVINALSDDFHPCQILADLQTISEKKGELKGLKAAFVGDTASNMAHSYLLGFATAGVSITLGGPASHAPNTDVLAKTEKIAESTGSQVGFVTSAAEAAEGADVIITDTWVSMGQEAEAEARKEIFKDFYVDQALMQNCAPDAIFMHCLPAYRGFEVSAEVIDGPQSVVFDQAENRLHAQKALMAWLLERAK